MNFVLQANSRDAKRIVQGSIVLYIIVQNINHHVMIKAYISSSPQCDWIHTFVSTLNMYEHKTLDRSVESMGRNPLSLPLPADRKRPGESSADEHRARSQPTWGERGKGEGRGWQGSITSRKGEGSPDVSHIEGRGKGGGGREGWERAGPKCRRWC